MYKGEIDTREESRVEKQVTESFILFGLAGTTYAISSRYVSQMEMPGTITPVPNTPAYIEGLMFSRGQVIPVINLRQRLGFPKAGFDLSTRVIVIRYNDRIAGLIVDSSREYVNLPVNSIQPPPEFVTGLSGDYLGGIVKSGERVILVFNVEGIMKSESEVSKINNDKEK